MSISNQEIKRVSATRGALLVVGMRWTDRLIGFVSTLILAHLLLPEDFGIVAMASVVVGLIDMLLDLGVGSALVQNKHAGREEFDTAWTIRLIQSAFVAVFLSLTAPFAAEYFRDARVIDVIRVMALSTLIGSFENIGIVAFQKNMEFGRDFQFFFFRRIAGFLVTMMLAFWLHSYWAMVIGSVVGRSVGVAVSYWLHSYRPKFSMARIKEIWSFSQWILVRNVANYGVTQIDKLLVGRRTDAATMGSYTLANDIAAMPTTELLAPISRVLFPVFVDAVHDSKKLRVVFCKAFGVQTILALPAGVGLCMVAHDAVPLLLGEHWRQTIPLIQTLSLISVFSALTYSSSYVLVALGKVNLQAFAGWLELGLLAFLAIVVFPDAGAQGIAYIRLATVFAWFIGFTALVLHYIEPLRLKDFIQYGWRTVFSTVIMALSLSVLPRFESIPLLIQLIFSVMFGAGIYVMFILLLWRISGCCEGAESYLLEKMHLKDRVAMWMQCIK